MASDPTTPLPQQKRPPREKRFVVTLARWRQIVAALRPFARRHVRRLVLGVLMSIVVISIRLTIPWLFKAMLKPLLSGNHNHRRLSLWLTDGTVEPTLLFGALFLVLLVAMGFADFLARLKFAQFAIGTVRDLRARAFASAVQLDPRIRPSGPGDLVARLIGDTARVKEGLKGFLTHVATNGLLLIGICAIVMWVDPLLGGALAIAVAAIIAITLIGAVAVYRKASKYRAKEGKLADNIQRALRRNAVDEAFAGINNASGEFEASVTKLQGRATWATHAIFGLAVLVIIWLGMREVADRRLATADMLLFIMYVLMMRSPIVQMSRQGTRTGKILACADRLEHLMIAAQAEGESAELAPLQRAISMRNIKVQRPRSQGRIRRLNVASLDIEAGSKIAIVGLSGSGKTTFLELVAGRLKPRKGSLTWDGADLTPITAQVRDRQIKLVPQDPTWLKQPLWRMLGLTEPFATLDQRRILKRFGVKPLIKRMPGGLASVLASDVLSAGERRALGLARVFFEGGSVLLLDDPTAGLSNLRAARRLKSALRFMRKATVLVALPEMIAPELFDRAIALRNGKIVYDGPPGDLAIDEATGELIADDAPALVGVADANSDGIHVDAQAHGDTAPDGERAAAAGPTD